MEKREGTEDRRIRRTRKQIQDAFIALTIEEGFASVTVHSITERADINRSTFYRYYQDKYDLLDALADEVVAEDASVEADEQEAHRGTVQLLGRIQQHAEFYQVMLSVQGDAFFAERFRQNIEKWFRDRFHEQDDPNMPPLDLRIKSVSYARVGAIVWWLEHSQDISADQCAHWLSQLSMSMLEPSVKTKEG